MNVADRLIIRFAREADIPAIAALHAEDVTGGHGDTADVDAFPRYLAAYREIEANPASHLFVGELDKEVVATFQLTLMRVMTGQGALHCDVEAVRTAERLQGQGIGKKLMTHAIAFARQHGCKSVKLSSNALRHGAHRFYEKLGFVKSHAGFKLKL